MMPMNASKRKKARGTAQILLQTGGEGAVYAQGGNGGPASGGAIKLYHQPNTQRSQKLQAFMAQGLARRLPPNVLAPQRLHTNDQGLVSGFEMALLPPAAQPWKKLSQPLFCKRYDLSLQRELELLLRVHGDLQQIHAAGMVVGDLNDHNLFVELADKGIAGSQRLPAKAATTNLAAAESGELGPGQQAAQAATTSLRLAERGGLGPGQQAAEAASMNLASGGSGNGLRDGDSVYWIDVDSYQFGGFPCPVALIAFLDPQLYGAGDFAGAPLFSPESDWYAFAVLAAKTLLKVHPYGGAHHEHKTLQARAKAGLSILHPSVTYPASARPLQTLDEDTLDYLREIFEGGRRGVFPASLLQTLRRNLTRCPHCNQRYATSRPRCPVCAHKSPRVVPATLKGSLRVRPLLQGDGDIVQLFVQPSGRMVAVARQRAAGSDDFAYRLVRLGVGGVLDETALFSGKAGVRFAFFRDTLVVNPPSSTRLMLLDVAQGAISALTTVESERFRGEAAFAATAQALYRIAGGAILRGQVQRGALLEEIVATAHRRQTQLWASPQDDVIAGYHHLFAEHHFFLFRPGTGEITFAPQTPPTGSPRTISDTDVAWGATRVTFVWQETGAGRVEQHWQVVDMQGRTLHHDVADALQAPFERLDGKVTKGTTVLHAVDGGVLKVQAQARVLLDGLAPVCSQAATLHWHPQGLVVVDGGRVVLVSGD